MKLVPTPYTRYDFSFLDVILTGSRSMKEQAPVLKQRDEYIARRRCKEILGRYLSEAVDFHSMSCPTHHLGPKSTESSLSSLAMLF